MARKHHAPWAPSAVDRALVSALGPDVAFLPVDGEVWALRHPRRGDEPRSPLLELVRAVWAEDPARAHLRLRSRIRLTSAAAPFDPDVAAVAARRWAVVDGAPGASPPVRWLSPPPEPAASLATPPGSRSLQGWLAWAGSVAPLAAPPARRATADRPVVAVAVGPDGRALAAARNAAGRDRTAHAEVSLLRGLSGALPPGSALVTTLQCCRMCAALWAACAPPDLSVGYGEADPGRFARGTRLADREQPLGRSG
jgi:tRNA(Arg) A34 adenosine deaminase TadA